jgi:hypothetical protein
MAMQPTNDHMPQTEHDFHRRSAADCFNGTWDYLEQKNRSLDEDQIMLNPAHASRYHWSLTGKPWNFTTGHWQISRVYAALNSRTLPSASQRRHSKYLRKTISRNVSYQLTKAWQEPTPSQRNIRVPKSSSTKRASKCVWLVLMLKTRRPTRIRLMKLSG